MEGNKSETSYWVSQNLLQICTASAQVYHKFILKQMQYRFSLNFGTLSNFYLNKAEDGQFPFELVYHLCYAEYNCTTSQDEYLYIDNCWQGQLSIGAKQLTMMANRKKHKRLFAVKHGKIALIYNI